MDRDEAIKLVRSMPCTIGEQEALRTLIPELNESEDERVRKWLVDYFKAVGKSWIHRDISPEQILTYLEKQKEPLPIPDKFSGLKSIMLQYLQSAANRKDDTEIESDTDLFGRKILDYVWKHEEQKPISVEEVLAKAGLKPYKDGNQWCILAGDNIQEGICGFGDTIDEALYQFLMEVLEKQKEQKPRIQDVELNDAVYDYVGDHFIAGADFTPEYIKKLMKNAFFAGVDYYLLQQESESCESDTNVEKVIEDVIRVYEKTQGEWVGGYDVDTLIVNLRRAFNKKEQKPAPISCGHENGTEWSEEDIQRIRREEYSRGLNDGWSGYTPKEWSEEDVPSREVILAIWELGNEWKYRKPVEITQLEYIQKHWKESAYYDKLKYLRTQPKQEWSEEDERIRQGLIEMYMNQRIVSAPTGINPKDIVRFLENLRPSWKPSEEQMKALEQAKICAVAGDYITKDGLRSLYEQLKKLM